MLRKGLEPGSAGGFGCDLKGLCLGASKEWVVDPPWELGVLAPPLGEPLLPRG